ncbi:MAG: 3-hydroxyacyl-CoA dehydrogenase family protein [Chloroflexi bacterium]|nr:3-hydroxyacyl-CoA dehydrogenase family protein [Chloroflexota bacterium]MCI0839168.1 3-hydroxyacyl-CoA dehydrogenase family protein [Chloroflexota bacterium]MCI0842591.1 3-hydroxyacyl-CoA dehydrogenase family protein [Chloroflexota bacterium]MCI0884069.1 3-hydroxyacyl-CoA dehydrogenase family protein [Chloroflexota bacterium]MCI0885329.1 3-hydroxyacyl-CoA dehydrogenase family protein [Chloroflexota bacterium]
MSIEAIGVIGGGVMGSGIGQALAVGGAKVTIRDIDDEMIAKSRSTIVEGRYGLDRGVERGKTTQEEADAALSRLSWTTSVADLAGVDLIVEAVPEQIELKKKVFGELDAVVKPAAIFASNTSGLAIADINKAVSEARRGRFVGMHFFSPAPVMQLVEIIHAPETAEETITAIEDLCSRAGKATVRVKDAPGQYGFIANRIYFAAVREAQKVLAEGIASPEDINKAMVFGFKWPVGPLAMIEGATKGWQ